MLTLFKMSFSASFSGAAALGHFDKMDKDEEIAGVEDTGSAGGEKLPSDARVETDSVSMTVCPNCGCEIDVEGISSFDAVECPDCSERVTVPAKLGQFLLTKMLGAGGMGAVYVGKDQALGRQVAIKVMLKSLGEDKEFIEAFKREAQAAAKINHPNICQIYSFGTEKNQPYIVMELISGKGFDSFVEGDSSVDQGLVMQVGLDIAQGLAAASEENLLHGDIKPENILLDEKLRAKLVDFGIASVAGQTSEGIWGTPYYIAPEKILRQKPDSRSDMYSLGATLYHALAGHPPFEGSTPVDVVKARLNRDPKPIQSVRKDVRPEVASLITRMLQRSPGMRHPTYASLVSDLTTCLKACGGRKTSLAKLKKTGHIMLTKRGKGATSASSSTTTTQPGSAQKTMPAIRVPKKSIVMPGARASAANNTGKTQISSHPKPKKPPSKAPLVIFLILVLLAVFGGGGYYLWAKHEKDLADRRHALAFNTAVSDLGKELTAVSNSVSAVIKIVNSASTYPAAMSNAVMVVLGETLIHPVPAPAPVQPKQAPAPAEKPKAAPTKAAAPAKARDSMGREAPAGMEEEAPAPPEPKKEEPPPPAVIDVPPPPAAEPRIKQLARKVIDDCILIQAEAVSAEEKQTAAATALEEGVASRFALVAQEKLIAVKNILAELETIQNNARTIRDRAKKNADTVEEIRADFVKAEEDRKNAAENADTARRAAEEAARKEEARLALISAESGLVAASHEQALALHRMNSYAEGLNILKAQAKELTTDEAKEAMDACIEEAQLLVDMKEFLAQQLTADPYEWGWIQDGPAVDVVKASVKEITTRTKTVSWQEVKVVQMLHFFKKYMVKNSIPVKTLGRMNLAAGVYCNLYAKEQPTAAQFAASYADTAVMHDPSLSRLVPKVIPPAPQE